mmetsp:Transcript_4375/g.10447  ORF Transcript_4375/g.10447 Transcript_4375/m.10447 type:complete len:332 (+) Transcript_4375:816-1811(+)
MFRLDLLELHANLLGNDGTTGEDGQILHGGLAVVTETRSLDGADLDTGTKLVDHESGESLGLDILGHNEQRLLRLDDRFQQRHQLLQTADLLLHQQNERVLHLARLRLGIGDEVGTDVSAIELHALDDLELVLQGLSILDGDDALLADALHGVRNERPDLHVRIGRDGADLRNLLLGGDGPADVGEGVDDGVDGELDAPSEVERIHPGRDGLAALGVDGPGEDGGGGRSVAGNVVGLAGDALDELGAHVLELVLEVDRLGDRDAVLGDLGGAVGLGDDGVAALGAEGDLDGVGQQVDSLEHGGPALDAKLDLLPAHVPDGAACAEGRRGGG